MRGGWVERGTVAIRLGRPHFAFFRGYLDGLEIGALASRYLAPSMPDMGTRIWPENGAALIDLRLARSMVRWIRAQLQVAARRSLGPADARLLGVAPTVLLAPPNAGQPSLEQFQDEHDPAGLYAEAELLALYAQAYPATAQGAAMPARRAARNQRLRLRQQRALTLLEQLVGADPTLSDPVDAWLDPTLAGRLAAVGVVTLADLLALIDRHGYRWYCKVPRVGLKAALHIAGWLQEDGIQAALGHAFPRHARQPARARGFFDASCVASDTSTRPLPVERYAGFARPDAGMAAGALGWQPGPRLDGMPGILDRLRDDAALNGVHGSNRGERCQLAADDDCAAIAAWLAASDVADHTLRAYRKESGRFLLWAILECHKPISSLTVEDCSQYRRFLAMLGKCTPAEWATQFQLPQDAWICARGVLRNSKFWRPFQGALSTASQRQAMVVIQSLLQWLEEHDYLHASPLHHAGRRSPHLSESPTVRALTQAEWRATRDQLPAKPGTVEAVPAQAQPVADSQTQIGATSGNFAEQKVTLSHRAHDAGATLQQHSARSATQQVSALRIRFILALAYGAGLRLSEMTGLRRRHLVVHQPRGEAAACWLLQVRGKGGATREVAVSSLVMEELAAYLAARGYTLAAMAPAAPLIAALPRASDSHQQLTGPDRDVPLSPQRLYCLVKQVFANAADCLASTDPEQAARLRSASPHWLRHTFATHALSHGMPLDILRDLLGHRSLETTSRYVSTERDRRAQAIEAFAAATAAYTS